MSAAENSTIPSPPSTSAPTVSSSSPSTATTATSTTPISSSTKLQPAPAPLVSAWGKKSSTSSSPATNTVNTTAATTTLPKTKASSTNGIQKDQWPSAEAALVPSANKDSKAPVPKPKTSGKGKWVPLKAEIVFPSASNNNKKKNNNSSNNYNGNNKKKQNQGGSKQQGQQQNNKGGKDHKNKKNNITGDSNSTIKSQSKTNPPNDKKVDKVTRGVEDLKVDAKPASEKTENGSDDHSKELTSTSELKEQEVSNGEDHKSKSKETPAEQGISQQASSSTQESQALKTSSTSASPVQQNQDKHINNDQQQYQPQQQNNNNNKKKFQHRNSEPLNQFNNNSQYQQNNNHKGGPRRYNPNKNNYNNYRHSVAGAGGYGNIPFFPLGYNNYSYMPMMAPPSYNNFMNFNQRPSSRSNSGSPANGEFLPLNGATAAPGIPSVSPINPAVGVFPPQIGGYPFVEDPLTLISNQVSYYFSIENLLKDFYLRKQMNSKGFVPLKKLIEFNRLKVLTGGDIQLLYSSLTHLSQLEVVNDKIRVRDNWSNWVLPFDQRDASGKEEDEGVTIESSPAQESP